MVARRVAWVLVGLVASGANAGCGSDSNAGGGPDASAGLDGAASSSSGGSGSGASSGSSGTASSGGGGRIGSGSSGSGSSSGGSGSGGGAASSGGSGGSSGSGGDSGGADASGAMPGASVLQMHNHLNRDGLFVDANLTKAALHGTMHLDTTFSGTSVVGNVYASPLYVQNGVQGKGTFYVVTESDNVVAIDESTGAQVWTKSAGTAAQRTGAPCGNIGPIGITGTPAIDLSTRLMVFSAATADSSGGIKTHTIHAWKIDDGSEAWNLDVSTLSDPVVQAFSPQVENQRSAVLIVGGVAYVAYGGHYGDCGSYHGWVVGVPLSGTSGAKAYATPAAECGIWAPGGPSSDGTDVFVATGNGGTIASGWGGAFAVVRLKAGPVFSNATTDYWRAVNDTGDEDLGGAGPLVVDIAGMTPSSLIVQLGKDGYAYLLDRANLGGSSSPVSAAQVMNDEISNAPAWATTPAGTFVSMVGNAGGGGASCPSGSGSLVTIKIDPAASAKITTAWCADNMGGGSPSISTSDGSSDALVWTMGTDTGFIGGRTSNQLHAWDLATGQAVITGSDAAMGTRHFSTPIIVHGRVIVGGDNHLYAFKP